MTASARMSEVASIVGEQHVVEAPARLAEFAIDGVVPAVRVTPGSVDEVAAVMRFAWERELVVAPAGGFVHQEIGNTPEKVDILLSLERLKTVEHYDPGDLTIGIGAGVTIGEIQALVRDQGQMLPIDTSEAGRVTLGGAMAVAAHGPLRHSFGGLREFCLGVRFVTADGKVAKAGGRVVKNVAGFDVMKLMVGSYGTLGVITSASFKLFPSPVLTRTFICEFKDALNALSFRDWIADSPLTPMCLELLSPRALNREVWTVAVRAGGSERVLARYASELGQRVSGTLDGEEEQSFWSNVAALQQNQVVLMSVAAPPQSAGDLLSVLERVREEADLQYTAWGQIGVGSLSIGLNGGTEEGYAKAVGSIRRVLGRDGAAILTRCPLPMKPSMNIWGVSPNSISANAAVKRAFDPKGILNRGRFLL